MITKDKKELLLKRLAEISSTGTLDGEDADRRENMHRLFMYPAMMVPATQTAIIKVFADVVGDIQNAIDPFMGSGTSLLSCMEFGLDVFGQDINPFAVLLSKAKTTAYDEAELKEAYLKIISHISSDVSESIDIHFGSLDKWFTREAQISFSKIRRAIQSIEDKSIRYFFWVLMSEAIRVGSNDRTSTFKLHRRSEDELSHRKVDVIKEFFSISKRGIDDYVLFKSKLKQEHHADNFDFRGNREIVWGDTLQKIETDNKFNLLVSSPPYGDNHTTVTYGQSSYLPLQWIDPADVSCPYDYIKTTQEIDRLSLGGRIDRRKLSEKSSVLFKKSKSARNFIETIPDNEKPKYNKTLAFIIDFDDSLDHIVNAMSNDAFFIWTIGNRFVGGREVPNAEVLQDLMQYRGYSLFFRAERQILNKKQPRKNNFSKTMEKEVILIFHKE